MKLMKCARAAVVPALAFALIASNPIGYLGGDYQAAAKPQEKKIEKLIKETAKKHGVPHELARAVVQVESSFNPKARGAAGEVGLMQIKPATARGMGYRGSTKALYNPETNLEWGMKYLAGAHKKAGGDLCGTILRYNAGHYAKRMNKISARYCQKVQNILGAKS
ncbi:lytic transglycosylase domain-containing protein [Pseudovibrio exalbescens]|uniref:Murein transglycosylase n=1 Tax=Pseudovibrio exalbescens TaxID=197461 RepID=A0A1U7JKX9_9HYPH|nr:lytic transglycosylase domain-containing protein [Pseudovibrio exalbescens]OKL45406.1 murein transglycosylase [Pseudovibrio exalbescens]